MNLFIDKIDLTASEDVNKKNVKGALIVENAQIQTGMDLSAGGDINLAASASNTPFNFQDVLTGKFVKITTATEVQVRINGTGNGPITLKAVTDANAVSIPGLLILLGNSVTSLHFTNPSATAAAKAEVLVVGTET